MKTILWRFSQTQAIHYYLFFKWGLGIFDALKSKQSLIYSVIFLIFQN